MLNGLTYQDLTNHIVPGPKSISYFIPLLLLPAALLIPPLVLSRWQLCSLFLPLIYASLIHAWLSIGGLDVLSMNVFLWSTFLLALKDPRRDFKRVHLGPKPAGAPQQHQLNGTSNHGCVGKSRKAEGHSRDESYPADFINRLAWVGTLLVSLRLFNWKTGDTFHDALQPRPPAHSSRKRFLIHAVLCTVRGWLLPDACAFYIQTDPYFRTSALSIAAPYPPPQANTPLALALLRLLPPRLLRTSIITTQAFALVSLQYYLPSIPAVLLNSINLLPASRSPHTWPPFFGPFSAVLDRGIRGLWGQAWHQEFRYLASTPGRTLGEVLGLPRTSSAAWALAALSGFGWSGVVHMGLVPPLPLHTTLSATQLRLCIAGFFWAQVPALAVEAVAASAARRWLPARWCRSVLLSRAVNAAWAAAWMCVTLPLLGVAARELRYWTVWPVPVSVCRGLTGQGWSAWDLS
ncbi:hypothetical protein BJ546DRAFT_1064108 [Cryomyces antarcticus]